LVILFNRNTYFSFLDELRDLCKEENIKDSSTLLTNKKQEPKKNFIDSPLQTSIFSKMNSKNKIINEMEDVDDAPKKEEIYSKSNFVRFNKGSFLKFFYFLILFNKSEDLLEKKKNSSKSPKKDEMNNSISTFTRSMNKKLNFFEDSFNKPNSEESEPPQFSLSRRINKPKLIVPGFEEIKDYKLEMSTPKLYSSHIYPKIIDSSMKHNSPRQNILKSEIKFYNDALLIISLMIGIFQCLIEELKLPASKKNKKYIDKLRN